MNSILQLCLLHAEIMDTQPCTPLLMNSSVQFSFPRLNCVSGPCQDGEPSSEPQFTHSGKWVPSPSPWPCSQKLPPGQSGQGGKGQVQSATQEAGIPVIKKSQIGLLHLPSMPLTSPPHLSFTGSSPVEGPLTLPPSPTRPAPLRLQRDEAPGSYKCVYIRI